MAAAPKSASALFDPTQWQVRIHSDLYSDPLPLRYFGEPGWSDRVRARRGANLVQIDQSVQLSLGSPEQGLELGVLKRQLGRLVMSEDTVRRLAQVEQGQFAAEDWTLHPDLKMRGFSGEGVQASYRSRRGSGWYSEGGVQFLRLTRLYGRDFQGEAAYSAASQSYSFDVDSTQVSSKLKLPFQSPGDTSGQGLLFNARAGWASETLSFSAGLRDWGRLQWRQVPLQSLNLTSSVSERDEQGRVAYRVKVRGQNSQPSLNWQAPWTFDVVTGWNISPQRQLAVMGEYLADFGWLPSVRWSDASGPVQWSAQWRQHQGDVIAHLRWKGLALGLSSRNFDADARAQFWSLGYSQAF